jgi:hypothetical protein
MQRHSLFEKTKQESEGPFAKKQMLANMESFGTIIHRLLMHQLCTFPFISFGMMRVCQMFLILALKDFEECINNDIILREMGVHNSKDCCKE